MLLKPFDDEEKQEQPIPESSNYSHLFSAEPVNALDLLLKGKRDAERVEENKVLNASPIDNILKAVGIKEVTTVVKTKKDEEKANAREIFSSAGATLEEAAKTVTHVMKFGDKTSEQLNAARLVATIHGALEDLEGKSAPIININVMPFSNNVGNQNILALVTPRG